MPQRMLAVLLLVVVFVGAFRTAAVRASFPLQSDPTQVDVPIANVISYQGWLQQEGAPVDAVCDLRFTLYAAPSGGNPLGNTLDRPNTTLSSGYFTVNDLDFGVQFLAEARWLQVAVRCPANSGDFTTLTPRQPLTAAPFAHYARNNWALRGNSSTTPATMFLGTTDAVTLTLRVSNTVALRLVPHPASPSLIGGVTANAVTSGVLGAVIGGGGGPDENLSFANRITDDYGVIGGGNGNQAGDNAGTTGDRSYATVGGGKFNFASGIFATIAGGQANTAVNTYAVVGGGIENNAIGLGATIAGGQTSSATGNASTVSGGVDNVAEGDNATVGGGVGNKSLGENATVGGGYINEAAGTSATIGGGANNIASATYAVISGGSNNLASGGFSTVGGGASNQATELNTTIGGGSVNQATGQNSTIGGGFQNRTEGLYALVSGGLNNVAKAQYSTVAGGQDNQANASNSTVGGGDTNIANGSFSTVAGGTTNEAAGAAATVSGGSFNFASGASSTVSGGVDANASHYGEWAYATGGFSLALVGEAQSSLYVLRGTTTNNSQTELFLDGNAERLTIAAGRTVAFEIQVVARSTGGESAGYLVRGLIENHLNITSLVGVPGPVVTVLGEDDAGWNVVATADNANASLKITATGANGDSIRWVATVRTTEVQE